MRDQNNNVIVTEYITNMRDLIHNKSIEDSNIATVVNKLLYSTKHFNIPLYLLTNSPASSQLAGLNIVTMPLFNYDSLSVYFRRIDLAFNFILQHSEIKKAAFVDASDVELTNYPFDQIKNNTLYIGDEPLRIRDTPIVMQNKNPDFIQQFLLENGHLQLLNPGIFLGFRPIVVEFLGMMERIIVESKVKQLNGVSGFDLGQFEMALTNYVAYKYFSDRLVHGRQVSTLFMSKEPISSSWFKHK
ncbi:hypothetical protein FEZ51_04135 [Pediococcus stilesii]|uniref:Uncharacterized protein n=1 Tax=Pediococcus stilesii TaxID=331679 RepID=A0A5R9BVY4_9LACO|nr:hypothetical protein [Pediococcus stilesii]TLQ04834.1 hypothetical protein FEZ51_04135 [Pediococcus stilesii]